jgi:hypothetical protein
VVWCGVQDTRLYVALRCVSVEFGSVVGVTNYDFCSFGVFAFCFLHRLDVDGKEARALLLRFWDW